ncbi:sigma E protease regulator RseP [Thalassotalea hakodatensis]|uniref:sigma E protease regulator RseP n=1 Tax=Thalassotalea hakodatensis TaxID=3030492 RepID=UPI002572EFB5|nr:sigma E protease regulator RseP [Thalassotalea hakodatensis]
MIEFLWNLLSFIVALGILITVHEYGHFWVARKNGVKVHRFAIGFGKPLWRIYDKHGTEFVIAMIPLGGYVKMLDERVDDVDDADKHATFNSKTVYQRIAIVAAGPLANFLFAIVAFYLMFILGMPSVKPVIGQITPSSIAEQALLTPNSEIVEVAGQHTIDWQAVNLALIANMGEETIAIKTRSSDSASVREYQLNTTDWQFSPEKQSAIESIGLRPYMPKTYTEIALVEENSPADKAGLQESDQILAIENEKIKDNWHKFTELIKSYPNQTIVLDVERAGKLLTIDVTPQARDVNGKTVGYLGLAPKVDPYPKAYQIEISYGIFDALTQSLVKTWQLVTLSFDMIGKLLTGDVSVKNLSGPIAIAQGAGDHAGYGFVYFLGFLALISINLGIINILPVPVLDGGHLVYYFIELLTGKPVSEKVQEIGFKFGTLAILGLMSIALFNDLSRL